MHHAVCTAVTGKTWAVISCTFAGGTPGVSGMMGTAVNGITGWATSPGEAARSRGVRLTNCGEEGTNERHGVGRAAKLTDDTASTTGVCHVHVEAFSDCALHMRRGVDGLIEIACAVGKHSVDRTGVRKPEIGVLNPTLESRGAKRGDRQTPRGDGAARTERALTERRMTSRFGVRPTSCCMSTWSGTITDADTMGDRVRLCDRTSPPQFTLALST